MMCNNLKVVFYEWSDIKRQPLGFLSIEDFKNFCFKSNIKISGNNNYYLDNINSTIYAICPKNSSKLVLSRDFKNLRKNFSKHNCNESKC